MYTQITCGRSTLPGVPKTLSSNIGQRNETRNNLPCSQISKFAGRQAGRLVSLSFRKTQPKEVMVFIELLEAEITAMYDETVNRVEAHGNKTEEQKIGTSLLHERHSYPGSEGREAKKPKCQTFTVGVISEPCDGPSSPDTKAEEPNIGTSLHKRPSYPGKDAKGPKEDRPKVTSLYPPGVLFMSRIRLTPDICRGKCLICSLVHDHPTSVCPYKLMVPSNAIISSGSEVVCPICDRYNGQGDCCKRHGHAVLKRCVICSTWGEHWSETCPHRVAPCPRLLDSPLQTFWA